MSALAALARTGWRMVTEFDAHKKLFTVRLIVRTTSCYVLDIDYFAAMKQGYSVLGYMPAGEHADVEEAAKIALQEYVVLMAGPHRRFVGNTLVDQAALTPGSTGRTRTRTEPPAAPPAPRTRERTRS